MARRVKEFVDITEHGSLDELIAKLSEIRDSLPEGADAEMRLRGDEVFGRKISISYFREQTAEEAECEARYAERCREKTQAEPEPARSPEGRRTLRIVA